MRTGKVMILIAVLALVLTPVLASASVVATATAKGKPVQIDTECPLDGNTTPLIAGQNMTVGSVEMSYVGDQLTVKYMTNGTGEPDYMGWYLREVHLYVGVEPPETNAPGQFPYAYDEFGYWETEFSFVIDLTEIEEFESGECLYIAAHAVVERVDYYDSDLDGFAAALPNQVTMSVKYPVPGDPSYFQTTVDTEPATILDGTYNGWCIDTDHTIGQNALYTADVYSSYEELPEGTVEYPGNLPLVNWIINQGFVGQVSGCEGANYTYGDVQQAIWQLIDDTPSTSGLGSWSQCRADEIKAAALKNGEVFEPDCGDLVAVVLVPVNGQQVTIAQVTFAEVDVECVPVFTDETAWGQGGCQFDRGWGMYFEFCKQCVDFRTLGTGFSVEGQDAVLEGLKITTPNAGAKTIFEGFSPIAYGAPNFGTCGGGSGFPTNGCLDEAGGFSNPIYANAGVNGAHFYEFTFNEPVDGFFLRMVDYGDFNPTSNANHLVKMTAYDEYGGDVVDEQILSFVAEAAVNPDSLACPATYPGGTGDACSAEPGQPGNYMWSIEDETGSGIGYITLEFGAGFDPKIGFDNLCVIR